MSNDTAAVGDPDTESDDTAQPRRVSPDISEVLNLIGAMERLVGDVEERHRAVGVPAAE